MGREDVSGGPVVNASHSQTGGMGSIPGWGPKISCATWQAPLTPTQKKSRETGKASVKK